MLRLHEALKLAELSPGALLFGRTVNRLVVGGEAAPVILELDAASKPGFVASARVIGRARQAAADGRISLDLERLVLPNGTSIAIEAVGLDEDGALGVAAEVFSSRALMAAGALASSFVSGYAASQQTQSLNDFGFSQTNRTGRNSLLQGVAQTAADQAKRFIDRETEDKPVLVLNAGAEVTVFINKEVRL